MLVREQSKGKLSLKKTTVANIGGSECPGAEQGGARWAYGPNTRTLGIGDDGARWAYRTTAVVPLDLN